MKILHTVQGYYPDSGGSEEVVRKLSEYLVTFGHDVTVATRKSDKRKFNQLNGVKIVDFDCKGNQVEGIRGDSELYKKFVISGDFDIMMNYAAQTWSSDLVFDLLGNLKSKKIFVPCGFSNLLKPGYETYYSKMPAILRDYDRVIYLSPDYIDTKFGNDHKIGNGIIIPNGADLKEFTQTNYGGYRKKHNLKDELLLINVSNHSTLKNHQFFWNTFQLLKSDAISAVLIGNSFHKFPKKWLTECYADCRLLGQKLNVPVLENLPRSEVLEAYIDADIFVFGSKVECSPLVMFESFASKTLFITTDCGNVKDYSDIVLVVKNENEAVDIINDFRNHKSSYNERVEKGYSYFLERLNWEVISREYEKLYFDLLNNS
ncbi:MAG: glycosyltransferase family 4 protein [Ignavibacteriales bacterium]|nr:glycosyltransferase family 4 protein [Ignavibacteriales bacterium]